MRKKVLLTVAILAFAASAIMYVVGKGSSHLSELYDMFWVPLPLGVIALVAAFAGKK